MNQAAYNTSYRQAAQRQGAVQIRPRQDHRLHGHVAHQPGRRSLSVQGHDLAPAAMIMAAMRRTGRPISTAPPARVPVAGRPSASTRRRRKRPPTSPSPTARSCATTTCSMSPATTPSPTRCSAHAAGLSPHRQGRRQQLHRRPVHPGHGDHRRRPAGADPRHALHHQPRRRAGQPGLGSRRHSNHIQAGFWLEENTSSAARYIWTNVTGPFDLGQFLPGPARARPSGCSRPSGSTQQFYRPGHGVAAR